jgi:hypothetical protein
MTWAKATRIHASALPGGVPTTGASQQSIITQRVFDELGIMQLRFASNPGTTTGSIVLQGRMSNDAPWSDVYNSLGRVEIVGRGSGTTFIDGPTYEGIPILPQMRAWFDNYQPTNNVNNFRIFLVE